MNEQGTDAAPMQIRRETVKERLQRMRKNLEVNLANVNRALALLEADSGLESAYQVIKDAF